MAFVQNLPPFFDFDYTNKDGGLTPNAKLYNDLTFQYLNQNFSFGMQIPNRTTDQIAVDLANVNIPIGTLWLNSDVTKLQFKTGTGMFETITST
jgi:hypothetical protein